MIQVLLVEISYIQAMHRCRRHSFNVSQDNSATLKQNPQAPKMSFRYHHSFTRFPHDLKSSRLAAVCQISVALILLCSLITLSCEAATISPLQHYKSFSGVRHHDSEILDMSDSQRSSHFTNIGSQTHRQQVLDLLRNDDQQSEAAATGGVTQADETASSAASDNSDNYASLQSDDEAENEQAEADGTGSMSGGAPDMGNEHNLFVDHGRPHNSRIKEMHDMFERRHLNQHAISTAHNDEQPMMNHDHSIHGPLQSSQELNPISIGLEPPFSMPPFAVGPPPLVAQPGGPGEPGMIHAKPQMSNVDNIGQGMEPALPFGLNPLPHLLGFQNAPFDGPQRGDQSAHSNHHTAAPTAEAPVAPIGASGGPGSGKIWPKIFRFTDGRINLSDFEKQKKIRLSNKNYNNENHIESAPIMFDGRELRRKSFLILHGGIFS